MRGLESEVEFCERGAQRCRELAKLAGPTLAAKLLSIAIEYDVEALKARMLAMAGNKPARPQAG